MEALEPTDLVRRHAGLIHKIAYAYCRDATQREDVVQEIAGDHRALPRTSWCTACGWTSAGR